MRLSGRVAKARRKIQPLIKENQTKSMNNSNRLIVVCTGRWATIGNNWTSSDYNWVKTLHDPLLTPLTLNPEAKEIYCPLTCSSTWVRPNLSVWTNTAWYPRLLQPNYLNFLARSMSKTSKGGYKYQSASDSKSVSYWTPLCLRNSLQLSPPK